MIKFFGKIRYHWQPELSWLVIYWSIALAPIFIGIALIYEKTSLPDLVLEVFSICVILVGLGFHRYFVIEETGKLRIVSLNIFKKSLVPIGSITKIEVSKSTIEIYIKDKSSQVFYMRKWPKKYFLDALALHPDFKGEVELTDNLIKLDYFEAYHRDKKAKG